VDLRKTTQALLGIASALVLAACGGDDDGPSSGGKPGNGTDLAFIDEMVPHHKSAIAMAKIAQRRGGRAEVTQLADDIIAAQQREIGQLGDIKEPLIVAGVKPSDLGISEDMTGMHTDVATLRDAKPFDREFIDMMVPHHQGAIRMARLELAKGQNAELKRIARAIVDGQAKEIEEMNAWRTDWYGAPSEAGGVPAEDEATSDDDGGHSGHGG
jgi:uncharacterized protein (DUF305 family)